MMNTGIKKAARRPNEGEGVRGKQGECRKKDEEGVGRMESSVGV